jgi:uncharacterized phage protein (TIGR01671 family)
MSRQIKFRVWDKLDERFIKCDEGYQGHYILSLNGEFHNLQNGSGGKDYIVQQWTGLTDKNDVEIYEGDIIHHVFDGASYPKEARDEILTCVWGAYGGMYSFENKDTEYYWAEIANRCEVIGNIFENLEPLQSN